MNPFTPGNGVEPAYLAGRTENISEFIKSLKAVEEGLPRNMVLYGLRGTGKTVLLRHYKIISETSNWLFINREFTERACEEEHFAQAFGKDLITLASEASIKLKIAQAGKKVLDFLKPEEISAYGITYKPFYSSKKEILEDYIADILVSNWNVFKEANKKGVVFLFDEFHLIRDKKEDKQYVLSSLLSAFAKVQREGYKYYLCFSGLPPLKTNLKTARTYSERMFTFQEIDNLSPLDAQKALLEPLKNTEYNFDPTLVEKIIEETQGYPYFLQFYGYFLIDNTTDKNITLQDFENNRNKLVKMLDQSFFEDRFKLASPTEKQILLAMAESTEKEIPANQLTKNTKMPYPKLQQYLLRLTDKGLIFRSQRGHYSFTIPLFQKYLQRQK